MSGVHSKGQVMERRPGKDSMGLRPMAQVMPSVLIPLRASTQRLLSGAGADSDSGVLYQHSVICQTCLPYRNPGDAIRRWQAKNGFLTLEVEAGRAYDGRVGDFIDVGLPYGPKPRLVLYHLNAEALRTRSPVIELGDSLSAFVKRTLGLHAHGRNLHGVRDQ